MNILLEPDLISLIFPVPDDDSKDIDFFMAGPEMPKERKPVWPGFYIRLMPDTQEWEWNEFFDGYWTTGKFFPHEIQEAIWCGAILKATNKLIREIEHLKQFGDFQ